MAGSPVAVKTPIQKVKPAANLSQKKREFVAPPTHPGKVLLLQFMNPLGLTVEALAARTGHSIGYIDALTRQHERVSEVFALALDREFGTGSEVWLNLQKFTDDFIRGLNEKA